MNVSLGQFASLSIQQRFDGHIDGHISSKGYSA